MSESRELDQLPELPWPRSGVDLFVPQRPRSAPALLEAGTRGWPFYAAGFRHSARALIEVFLEQGYMQDFFALPVMFLYRHYVELTIKSLLIETTPHGRLAPKALLHHELPKLWVALRDNLAKLDVEGPAIDATAVEELINRLAMVDPDGTVFRYPIDRNGRDTLPVGLRRLDLVHFAEQMEAIAGWFEGTEAMLEIKAEYDADMAAEFFDAEPD